MEVKPGYKQTEVGVIPEDWEVCQLDSLGAGFATPIKAGPFGSSLTKDTYVPTGFKVYGQEQVIRGDYLYGDYFISPDKYRALQSCAVSAGDVLLSLVGTTGKLLVVPECAPAGIINPRLIRFSFDRNRVWPRFFKDLFEAAQVQSLLARYAQGGTMGVLNAGMLRQVKIPLPPLPEQRAIATALSDADALIIGLEKLIAKKRAIKQGAMQELLTGKKRLPGFQQKPGYKPTEVGVIPEDWEVKKLGEIADISKLAGFEYSKYFNSYNDGGEIIVIRGTNITNNKLDLSDIKTIPRSTSNKLQRSRLQKDDLVFAYVGTIGPVCLIEENAKYHLGPNTARITVTKGVSPRFILCYFTSSNIKTEIIEHTSIGAQPSLSMTKIRRFKIPLPPTLAEQTAIAQILSNMDAEIEALEKKLAKYRQIKQGMMQELLTGKIRLV